MNEHVVACLHRLRLHYLFLFMLSSTSPACASGENVGERELFRLDLRPEEEISPKDDCRLTTESVRYFPLQAEIESNVAATKQKLRAQLKIWKGSFLLLANSIP